MKLEPGTVIGSYRIVSELGRGGMATVYKAYQASLARHVALKVLPDYFAEEPGFRQRFQQEAIAVANLRHPNIPAVHDYGETEGVTYIVSEYIDGGTLTAQLGKPLPADHVIEVLSPVASALDYAHAKGVLHRDVKPSNVLMARDGTPVLADFGLAKMMASDVSGLTRTGTIVGTPEYMSPEQCEGGELTPAADQYSLGVVAYELLTGRPPFVGSTPLSVVLGQVREPVPKPRSINPELPEALEQVLLKVLEKDPADRYSSCDEFVRALSEAQAAAPVASVAVAAEPAATAEAPETASAPSEDVPEPGSYMPAADKPARRTRRPFRPPVVPRRLAIIAASVVLLALVAGGGTAGLLRFTNLGANRPSGALQLTPSTGAGSSPAATVASPSRSPSPASSASAGGTKPSPPAIQAIFEGSSGPGGGEFRIVGSHFTPGQTASVDWFDPPNSGTFYPRWTAPIQADGSFVANTLVSNSGGHTGKFEACDSSHHCASTTVSV